MANTSAWFVPEGRTLLLREDLIPVLMSLDGKSTREVKREVRAELGVMQDAPEQGGSVAIVPLIGPVTQYEDECAWLFGGCSLEGFMERFQSAVDDPSVTGIVLLVDSPGGEAAGVADAADRIRAAAEKKKVVCCITGDGASAGYWLSAAASKVVASQTAVVGSIGAAITYIDDSEAEKQQGIRRITFVSSVSPNKRLDPSTSEGKKAVQAIADAFGQVFIEKVATFRGVSVETALQDFGQGGVFVGAAALSAGLVDQIGTLDDAIQLASTPLGGDSTTGATPPTARASTATGGPSMTAQEILAAHPAAAAEIAATGAATERTRISAILKLNTPTNRAFAGEQIDAAILDGKTNAGDLALAILAESEKRTAKVNADRHKDKVPEMPSGDPEAVENLVKPKVDTVKAYENANRGIR